MGASIYKSEKFIISRKRIILYLRQFLALLTGLHKKMLFLANIFFCDLTFTRQLLSRNCSFLREILDMKCITTINPELLPLIADPRRSLSLLARGHGRDGREHDLGQQRWVTTHTMIALAHSLRGDDVLTSLLTKTKPRPA